MEIRGPSVRLAEPVSITFSPGGTVALSITPDGKLVAGEGLSEDEATRGMFKSLADGWPHLIEQWAKAHGWTKP